MVKNNWKIYRGDIYLADLGENYDSLLRGIRPVVIVQNDLGNQYSPLVTVVPITSRTYKKPGQPTHFLLDHVPGLTCISTAQAEQISTFGKQCLIRYLGKVNRRQMLGIEASISAQLGIERIDKEKR